MDVLGVNQLRRVVCLKRSFGFSTQARNGTCCRRATRTTKLCIGAFRLGAAMRLLRRVLMDFANELCDRGALNEEECFIDATFVSRWRVGNRSYEARKRHENHGDCGSPWIAAFGQHARGKPSRSAFGFEPSEPWSTTYRISSVGRERPWLNLSSGGRCTKYSAMREGATEDGRAYDATHVRTASRLISDGKV